MKIDKYVKDLSKRLDSRFPSPDIGYGNNEEEEEGIVKDDNYYLERRLEPPRFAYYKAARRIMIDNNKNKKPVPAIITSDNIDEYMQVYDTITQDELDYHLKMKLKHTTPEQRYQDRKETYYFHELYRDDGGYGCNGINPGICVPECRYYAETGRIEDEELIQEHKKMEEFYRKHNAIIDIKFVK